MLMVTMVLFNNFRCYMSSWKKDTKHIMTMLNFRYSYEVVLLLEYCRNLSSLTNFSPELFLCGFRSRNWLVTLIVSRFFRSRSLHFVLSYNSSSFADYQGFPIRPENK